ncbi:fungal specific transcription factor domain-containing protein [Botrytis cinerea]
MPPGSNVEKICNTSNSSPLQLNLNLMSMITSPPSSSPIPRRRKRKDQACEPCRKAKTRCDHTTPICLRCQRKGAAANCIYVPSHPPRHGHSSEHSISNPSHPVRDIRNNSLVSPQPSESIDSRIDHAATSRKVFGFYGPTSFSAPFLDNENGLVSDVDDEGECTFSPGSITTPPALSIVTNGQQTAEISLGMRILSQLPDQVTSFKLWRRQGDTVHLATALGLHHCAVRPDAGVTTSLEIKRRIFCAVFVNDKTLSIFTGRPPGLSHRYNSCPLPLDLEDEILLAGKETLQEAASKLDENGWNREGNIYSCSRIRASMMYGEIIDEILEISLGTVNQFSEARIMDLRKRNEDIQERLPPWLRLSSSTPTNLSATTHWIQTALKFNCLQCSFILEQVFVRKVKDDKQPLLDISRQLLALTVSMWTSKDRFLTYYSDYDWIIMCYGIPSAGVICIELIKEMESPAAEPAYYLPRSEVIQNLSLLVGFLDWVRPTAANHELCGRMRQIVKRTLDKILDSPKITNTPQTSTSTAVPISNLAFEPMVMDDLDWLDTIDWAKGPFMDLRMEGYNEFS